MWMRTPAKQEAGAEATVVTLHGVPPIAAPSGPNPWSRVTWFAGMAPLVPATNWLARSIFHGALVARPLYSPVPSWKLERENPAGINVLLPHGVQASPMRGRKLAMPLYWL